MQLEIGFLYISQDGMTALMLASVENHPDVVKMLLSFSASVNAEDQVCLFITCMFMA